MVINITVVSGITLWGLVWRELISMELLVGMGSDRGIVEIPRQVRCNDIRILRRIDGFWTVWFYEQTIPRCFNYLVWTPTSQASWVEHGLQSHHWFQAHCGAQLWVLHSFSSRSGPSQWQAESGLPAWFRQVRVRIDWNNRFMLLVELRLPVLHRIPYHTWTSGTIQTSCSKIVPRRS